MRSWMNGSAKATLTSDDVGPGLVYSQATATRSLGGRILSRAAGRESRSNYLASEGRCPQASRQAPLVRAAPRT